MPTEAECNSKQKKSDRKDCQKHRKCDFMCNSMDESRITQKTLKPYTRKQCRAACTRIHTGKAPFNNKKALKTANDAWLEAGRQEKLRNKASIKGAIRNQTANEKRDERAARRAREKLRKAAGEKVSVKKGKAKDIIRAMSVKNLDGKKGHFEKRRQQRNRELEKKSGKTRRRGYAIYYQPKLRF